MKSPKPGTSSKNRGGGLTSSLQFLIILSRIHDALIINMRQLKNRLSPSRQSAKYIKNEAYASFPFRIRVILFFRCFKS